jgi:dCMP deaminase
MLVNARIARFVTFGKYSDDRFIEIFKEAGIKVDIKDRPSSQITYLD